MTDILQTDAVATPEILDIPDIENLSNLQIMWFAARVADSYIEDSCRLEVRERLKKECFKRIKELIDEDIDDNIQIILSLAEVYVYALFGAPLEPSFGGPRYLWDTRTIKEMIVEYFSQEEKEHTHILDFIYLYKERISKEN